MYIHLIYLLLIVYIYIKRERALAYIYICVLGANGPTHPIPPHGNGQPGDVPIPVKPRFYNFTVKLSNGAETVLRPIADDGSFSASGLANGTWKAEVISKDPNYKAFTVINPISSKELENGDLWKLSIIFKETKGKINIQRGIEK